MIAIEASSSFWRMRMRRARMNGSIWTRTPPRSNSLPFFAIAWRHTMRMGTVVSLDGVLVEPEQAKISVFDRGFLYGDSVYEVIRTYEGVPFELEAHLARLDGSARRIGMGLPVPPETIG